MSSLKDRVKAAKNKTPRHLLDKYTAWRMYRPEIRWDPETLEVALDILRRREEGYKHMRSSPSMGNHCIRQSVIAYMGYKSSNAPNIRVQGLFDDGNFGHLKWQMLHYQMGVLVKPEVVLTLPGYGVAGTCDGILEIPLEGYERDMERKDVLALVASGSVPVWRGVAEYKQMGSWRYKNNKVAGSPEPKVRWQGDIYYEMANRYEHNLDGTMFWFENKDNAEITEYDLAPTKDAVALMHAYYDEVQENVAAGILPERPFLPGSTECNSCFHAEHCDKFTKKGKTTIKPARGATMGDFEVAKQW